MKTIDFSYFIERYITNEMDAAEKRWFELELECDSSLQKELKLRKLADASLVRHDIIDLRNKLSAIEKQRREKVTAAGPKKSAAGMRFAAAVAALMLLGGVYLFSTRHLSNETLYRKNFQTYVSSNIARSGETKSTDLKSAQQLYNNKDYAASASLLKKYIQSNPVSMDAMMMYGAAEMENKNFEEAQSSFRLILANGDNLFLDKAQWYLALCYLQTNQKSEAVKQLESIINSKSVYRERSKKLIRRIR